MRRTLSAALLALLLAVGAPAHAQDASAHDLAFRRAELRERSLGDLPRAAELYLEAARSATDSDGRARAELRAAACLLRSGEPERALEIASRWLKTDGVSDELRRLARDVLGGIENVEAQSPVVPQPTADPQRAAELEEERDQALLRLQQSLDQADSTQQEMEALYAELRSKERENEKLRARLPPPEPETAEEALRLRQQQLQKERRQSQAISAAWTGWAARLHQAGRFAEACEVLYDALAKDRENTEAKALLARVAAPLGDRERLHLRIREVLALAREVRVARLIAEVEYLTQQGRRLQERGDFAASVPPLERALAMTGARLLAERGPARLREDVEAMLQRAESAGSPRRPAPPSDDEPLDSAWAGVLQEMLAVPGREIQQGLTLRFHDLDPILPATSLLLPPAPTSDPPAGWTLSTQGADAGALLTAWLRGGEAAALAAPGTAFDLVGSTVVVLADDATQARLQSRISAAALAAAPAAEVEIAVIRAAPGAWDARLASRGLTSRTLDGGGRASILPPADVEAMLSDAGDGAVATASRATFRAAHLQPFRLIAEGIGRSISIDVLAVSAGDPGVALQVETAWRPVGRTDAAFLSQRARAGAPLIAGGALALHGLTDPVRPSSDLVVVVKLGQREMAVERAPAPREGPELSATEHLLPRSIARVQELNAALLPLPRHPIPERGDALRRRLVRAAGDAVSIEVRGDRVFVVGTEPAQDGVRAMLGRLSAVREPQRFRVEAFTLSPELERAVINAVPAMTRAGDSQAATANASGRQLAAVRQLLASSARAVPLTEPVVATPPTVRADAAHVVRTPFRRELEVAPGEATSWGRAETGTVDQGFLLALRPFGRDARGRDHLDISLRTVRLAGVPARDRETPLGPVELVEPHMVVVAGDFSAILAADDTLLIGDVPSPFGGADSTDRLLLLVHPER